MREPAWEYPARLNVQYEYLYEYMPVSTRRARISAARILNRTVLYRQSLQRSIGGMSADEWMTDEQWSR